jgi:prepilin-type N-terminal cleavage/methylation domain-containing protein
MKFVSIGLPAVSRLRRDNGRAQAGKGQAGFTLLEALVALALVLAFAAVLGPHLSQARRIMDHAESRVAAHVLLRSLLDAPFDRSGLASASLKSEANGLRWSIVAAPVAGAKSVAPGTPDHERWLPYRLTASVVWGADQVVTAETIRLGRPEP